LRVWFDISNSPHINIYKRLIREIQAEHEVVITARHHANTVDLLELHALPFEVVGRHYGASKMRKACGYPVRVWQLYRHLRHRRLDVAISHSSFHSPVVARMLGIPSIYMNDNEHALGNVPAFLCATKVMVPEFMSLDACRKQGASWDKIIRYPGVKEGFYLWSTDLDRLEYRGGQRRKIFVRPEPWTALYYDGVVGFLDELLLGLHNHVDVVLLPRGPDQAQRYKEQRFRGIVVQETPLALEEIARSCALFIGAGGTMTREMAVLGVPTISVYQAQPLGVDRHLIDGGVMMHNPKLTAAEALDQLSGLERRRPNRILLDKGEAAYRLVKETLLELGASGNVH